MVDDEISVCLNEKNFGVAFGPEVVRGLRGEIGNGYLFPAVSLKTKGDFVTFSSPSIVQTLSLHWTLDMEKVSFIPSPLALRKTSIRATYKLTLFHSITFRSAHSPPSPLPHMQALASLGGKMCARMISGPTISLEEVAYESWLRSDLIIGGLESNDEMSDRFILDVAARTSVGMSLLVESQFDSINPDEVFDRYYVDGVVHDVNKVGGGLKMIEMKTTKMIRDWILPLELDEYDEVQGGGAGGAASPTSPTSNVVPLGNDGSKLVVDLYVRDKILNELCSNIALPYNFIGSALMAWLESSINESFLKRALSRTNSYEFPVVEMPFIAALLKHTGLWREIIFMLDRNHTKDSRQPSGMMKALFFNVKQLRAFLR